MLKKEITIIESDGDLPFGAYILAGLSERMELTVEYVYTNYETGRNTTRLATVDTTDTVSMSKYLKAKSEDLPEIIYDECGDSSGISVPSEVEATFKKILDFILDCGVRYKLR